jgi:hypothetical protein
MTNTPKRDPKYSGWPGPEEVAEAEVEIVDAPKPKKKAKVVEEAAE